MKRAVLCGLVLLPLLVLAQTKKTSAAGAKRSGGKLATSISNGQAVYQKFCLTCHQVDGSGVPNLNPPLTRTKWTLGSKAVLIHQVLNGSHGTVEIDGDTFHNTMPPLGQALTDQQVADVLTYVRNNFGNKASAVTPAEVKTVRAKTK
jgi:mono/diheme cytochrome c family protein